MRLLSFLLCWALAFTLSAQQVKYNNGLDGYWTGAFIRNGNSIQQLNVEFYAEGDSIVAASTIPDWAYYRPNISKVEEEGDIVRFKTYYGMLTLVRDSAYAEMVGSCDFAAVHLKKGLRPPRKKIETLDYTFTLGDIKSEATITKPVGDGPWTTVVMVHGRGCGGKETWTRRPELLAEYGLAVVRFDKRGHERTDFPCIETTMDMHSKDLAGLTEQLVELPFVGTLGYIGSSAGGWVAPKAAAETDADVAFIISIVGPSTSVKQQQLDCCIYYLRDAMGKDDRAIAQALAYTELEFSREDNQKVYDGLMSLLDSARVNNWIDVLVEDDIPSSPEGLNELWVRRNDYDPAEDIKAFKGPFLSILGGSDYVVPYRENRDQFINLFESVGKVNYQISILPSMNHGLEHGPKSRDLGYQKATKQWPVYFKYDRVAAGVMDEIIAFLRKYEFID